MLLCHLCQHVVRRPIDNAHDLCNAVRRQALLQRLDYGDAAADTRLIEEVHIVCIRNSIELGEMLGNNILICRNNVLPRCHRAQHIVLCRSDPPHNLYNDGDLIIVQNLIEAIR